MPDHVIITREDHVAVVSIDRAPTNFFDEALIRELASTFDALADDGARAIVLASEGKHFCAGANFGTGEMVADREGASSRLYREAIRIFRSRLPIVAGVQGSAVGGGLGLACAADFRTASPASRFHANFSMLGFHQGFGLSASLPAIVGPQRAAEMLYTSRRVGGEEAAQIGLVDRLTEPGQERHAALEMAREIASAAPLAVQSMKQTLRAGLADQVEKVLERELAEQSVLWVTEDSAEGIRANLARETPRFSGR